MWVPPYELHVDVPRDLRDIPLAVLRKEQGQQVDLEEEIAELVEELGRVAGEGGVGHLVSLFDRVRHDRPRGLLTVPGTVAPQALGQRLEIEESLVETAAFGGTRSPRTRAASFAVAFVLGFVSQPVVVAAVVVAGGARPAAYEIFPSYSFFSPFSQVWRAVLRFCWSSCCLIDSFTCAKGVE